MIQSKALAAAQQSWTVDIDQVAWHSTLGLYPISGCVFPSTVTFWLRIIWFGRLYCLLQITAQLSTWLVAG